MNKKMMLMIKVQRKMFQV